MFCVWYVWWSIASLPIWQMKSFLQKYRLAVAGGRHVLDELDDDDDPLAVEAAEKTDGEREAKLRRIASDVPDLARNVENQAERDTLQDPGSGTDGSQGARFQPDSGIPPCGQGRPADLLQVSGCEIVAGVLVLAEHDSWSMLILAASFL